MQMRPGVKVTLWSPRYKNMPDVEPPGLLKLLAAISVVSVIGMLFYGVAQMLAGSSSELFDAEAVYVVGLHFVLPIATFYSVSTNSPLSRWVIALYFTTLCFATAMGKGFLGQLAIDEGVRIIVAISCGLIAMNWLFRTAKMRFYYACISGRPIPDDLASRIDELHGGAWMGPKARATLSWVLDHLELVVVFGFIATVLYAFSLT